MTISWFGLQSHAGYSLSVAPQNRWEGDDVGHVLRSSELFRVEASRARVTQCGFKTVECATASDARGTIIEVALSPN
jgi:hypothetical protein